MAGSIKGIIVEIGGDTSGLQKALSKVNSASSSLSKELRGVNSLLKLDPKNVELLEQKQTLLNQSIETTQDKLDQLKKIKDEADKKMAQGTKISEENYRNLQREIINTQNKLNGLTDDLKQFNAQNSNWTKAGKKVEEYGNKITKVSNKVDEIGNKAMVASAGVIAGGTALVNSAMNLEDAVAKYVASTNTATDETEKYKGILEEINKNNYGDGYEDIANSMASVKMQLKDLNEQDLQNITEKAIALRDMFGYEVAESVRAVKAMMDNFNVSADEAFNLIAEGKKQGLDFSNELLDNVNEYSVQFKKLGLSAQDMFNIFKVGADNGAFNLDKIGDAVKEFSIRAIDGSNTTIDGFKRIGLNADTMAKKFANGGEEAKKAFIEVVNRLGSMDDKVSQSIAGVDLFGTMWEDLGPTVVTSFSKMDNGISQSSDTMQKSIDELYNTTKKKAETQLKRLQSLGADFGEEMLPVLEDLIDLAEKFTKKLEGMSDEEKENIVKMGLLVAGAGPLIKTMGTLGKGVGTVTKGLGIFSQAIGVVKNGTVSANAGVNTLAKGLSFLSANPMMLMISAVTALSAAFALNYAATIKEKAALGGLKEEVIEQSNSWRELQKTRNDTLSSSLPEIEKTQKLADELREITDENGKVKTGYEERAQVILGLLNTALGTEYELNGNIISQYKDLKDNIDKVIASKKAEAVLTAYQEEYNEAMKKQTEATETLVGLKQKLAETAEKMATGNMKERKEAEIQYSSIAQQIGEQTKLIGEYGKTITDYDNLRAASISGNEKQIEEATKNMMTSYEQIKQKSDKTIEQQVISQGEYIKVLNEGLTEAKKANDEYQAGILESQLQTEQQKLANLADSLVKQTMAVEELTPEQISAWRTLAENSYMEYTNALGKVGPTTSQKIQEATGIVVNDASLGLATGQKAANANMLFGQNLKLADSTNTQITNSADVLKKDVTVQDEAKKVAERAGEEFEKADSKSWGEKLIEDLGIGMNGKSQSPWFSGILSGIANLISSRLSSSNSTSNKTNQLPGHKSGLDYVPYDNYVARLHKGERVLTAKENKQLMAVDKFSKSGGVNLRNLANNISNKNNFYFNLQINPKSLTESDMKKCFDYWEREAGKYI